MRVNGDFHELSLNTAHVGVALALVALGFVAMGAVKGSPAHKLSGRLFVAAMLAMAATGVVLVAVGLPRAMLTAWAAQPAFYLALTGWLAARQQRPGAGLSEIAGVAVASLMAIDSVFLAETAKDARVGVLFAGAAIATLLAAADLRIALRGGLARPQRIRRHLWRMGFSVVVATAAIATQAQRFPEGVRPYLPLLILPPLAFTLIQLFRYRARRRAAAIPAPVPALEG
jgi:hypothetical protein